MRMKHNAMLKSEFDEKMKKLQDKWVEVENASGAEMPSQNDIERMVGLVNSKLNVKTMAEMIKEKSKSKLAHEEKMAKNFIKRLKQEKDELDKEKEDRK